MDKLALALDRALSLLPGNEYKLVTGLALKSALPLLALVPGLNVVALATTLDYVADALIAVGAAHKAAKTILDK